MKSMIALGVAAVVACWSWAGSADETAKRQAESRGGQRASKIETEKKKEDHAVGHFVIVCYRPKPGKDAALLELVRNHVPDLRKQGLVTERPGYAMRAKDGTIVEVFEWKSVKATEEAHTNPAVQAMWKKFGEACDYELIGNLPEAKQMFSGFEAID